MTRQYLNPTLANELVDRIRFDGLSLRIAAHELGCGKDVLRRRCWSAAKQDAFRRDGNRCLFCGFSALDAHHRSPRGMGGTSDPLIAFGLANLVSLCRPSHDLIEKQGRERGWSYEQGWLVKHPRNPAEVPVLTLRMGWVLLGNRGEITPCAPPDDYERQAA